MDSCSDLSHMSGTDPLVMMLEAAAGTESYYVASTKAKVGL